MIRVDCRPLDGGWRGPQTADRKPHPFKAGWGSTLELIMTELAHLDAERAVLEADFAPADLRVDGWPRSNARQPAFPGVRLSFESNQGPLVYATDVYGPATWSTNRSLHAWQANVRAIALGLGALRAVDRHGITRSGEQYTGFRAIGSGPAPAPPAAPAMTREEAVGVLVETAGWDPAMAPVLLDSEDTRTAAYRLAIKASHPDRGGDPAVFASVTAAWEVLTR